MSWQVRDRRKTHFFTIDNEIIDVYAKEMKPFALAVYVYLCRRANQDEKAWPSQRSIAADLGVDRGTVRTAVKQLSDLDLIAVEVTRKKDGSYESAIYYLLDVKKQEKEEKGGGSLTQGGPMRPEEDPVKKVIPKGIPKEKKEKQWDSLLEEDKDAVSLREFAEHLASLNKSGKKLKSALWTDLGEPFTDSLRLYGRAATLYGMNEAKNRGVGFPYAKACAKNWKPDNVTPIKQKTKLTSFEEEDPEGYARLKAENDMIFENLEGRFNG